MKAQIKQVFVYGMMIIIIGFVLLIGVQSITKVRDTTCDTERVTFQRDIISTLESNTAWGRENTVDLVAPCDFKKVCFVDVRSIGETNFGVTLDGFDDEASLIQSSVQEGIERNIFLVKRGLMEPVGYSEVVELECGSNQCNTNDPLSPLCVDAVSGRFTLKLSGQGRTVVIK